MHVCMIAREFPPRSGGIGYYVYNLSKKLLERGYEVTVMTRGSTAKLTREIVDGITVFKVSFFPVYPLHNWIHGSFLNALIKSLEPKLTLIHLHTPLPPPIKTVLPIITTVHTPMKIDARYHEVVDIYSLAEKVQSMVVSPFIESKLFGISQSITSVSYSVAKELKEYGLDSEKITVVGNGVDQEVFTPARKKGSVERYVLYTGVLRARKGLFDLLECARYVCRRRSDVRFLICGNGPLLPKLNEKIRKLELQERVVLLGHVRRGDLVRLCQNATVHVVPSHYEGLPTVLLEAMSCALPVVATNVGGTSEVISNGSNGFLVPPKSPERMSELILRLLDDDTLREEIGKAARKTILEHYTWNTIADNVTKCYEDMLPERVHSE